MKIFRREAWTNREDEVLKAAVTKYGFQNWAKVSSMLRATNRDAQQCSARWFEFLSPAINCAEWTQSEEDLLEELVLTFGSNWRTIAQQIKGRSATQCQQKHGQLLERAAGVATTNNDGSAVSSSLLSEEGSENNSTNNANNKVLWAQVDSRHEVRAAKKDTVDADADEMMMLDEARARLANTKGRKDMRKQKEREMLAAKQRAAVQHHRELRAAAAAFERSGDNGNKGYGDEDDDFVPISTADVDRGAKSKQQGGGGSVTSNKKGKSDEEQQREILEKARQLTRSEEESAASLVDSGKSTTANKAAGTPTFNLSFQTLRSNNSNNTSNNNLIEGPSSGNAIAPVKSTSGLIIPRALQEKRRKALELQQQQQQEAKKKQHFVVAPTLPPIAASSSSASSVPSASLASSIALAIADGGRTRREQEALNRSGASMSFVHWLKQQQQQQPNECRQQQQLSTPNPGAIKSFLMLHQHQQHEIIDRMILEQVAQIVSDDSQQEQRTAETSSTSASSSSPSGSTLNSSSFFFASDKGNETNNQDSKKSNFPLTEWADECALQEIADAAQLIENEFKNITKQEDDDGEAKLENSLWRPTPEIARFAASLANQILNNTSEFKLAQRRVLNLVNSSPSSSSSPSSTSLFSEFRKLCEDNAVSHDEAARSSVIARATNQVRLWEEACLQTAYQKSVAELNRVRVEADAAAQVAFSS